MEAKLNKLKADIDIKYEQKVFLSPYIAGTERQTFPFFLPATVLHHSHTRGRCPQLVIVFFCFCFVYPWP